MRRTPLWTLGVALVVAVGGIAVDATYVPSFDAPMAPLAMASETSPASGVSKSGSGRSLSMDDAIRELDLIRPSRQKLADDFTLPTADGKTFRLSAHRGRPVFVNFWATWCPPCLEEMPAMERLWRAHKHAGLVMVAVTVDTNPKAVAPFVERHGLTFAVGLDSKMEVANSYGVRALPASFVIDREGRLAALAIGPRVWDNVAAHALIERLVAR